MSISSPTYLYHCPYRYYFRLRISIDLKIYIGKTELRYSLTGVLGTFFLDQWCFDAMMSDIRPLTKVALTLIKHREGILNYFPHLITNGSVEETINKIKTLKRQAWIQRYGIFQTQTLSSTLSGLLINRMNLFFGMT